MLGEVWNLVDFPSPFDAVKCPQSPVSKPALRDPSIMPS